MRETTADRLKQIMKLRGLRQVDILEKAKPYMEKYNVKLGRNSLSQYISGVYAPSQDKLSVLGRALDVSEAWLLGYDVPMERDTVILPYTKGRLIPVLGSIAAGLPKKKFRLKSVHLSIRPSDSS